MIFSLFGNSKSGYKVQLINYKDIVIGSGTDLERAFQIGNFMNMLHQNIENKNKPMALSAARHNLITELNLLIKYCIDNNDDYCAKDWYVNIREQIIDMIDLLVDELKSIRKLERELSNLKGDIKKQTKEIIDLTIKSAYKKYDIIVNDIVFTFPEYFEYIKINNNYECKRG